MVDSVGSDVTRMDATGAKEVLRTAVVEDQANIFVGGCGDDPGCDSEASPRTSILRAEGMGRDPQPPIKL